MTLEEFYRIQLMWVPGHKAMKLRIFWQNRGQRLHSLDLNLFVASGGVASTRNIEVRDRTKANEAPYL
jgi:hypothetical protein